MFKTFPSQWGQAGDAGEPPLLPLHDFASPLTLVLTTGMGAGGGAANTSWEEGAELIFTGGFSTHRTPRPFPV